MLLQNPNYFTEITTSRSNSPSPTKADGTRGFEGAVLRDAHVLWKDRYDALTHEHKVLKVKYDILKTTHDVMMQLLENLSAKHEKLRSVFGADFFAQIDRDEEDESAKVTFFLEKVRQEKQSHGLPKYFESARSGATYNEVTNSQPSRQDASLRSETQAYAGIELSAFQSAEPVRETTDQTLAPGSAETLIHHLDQINLQKEPVGEVTASVQNIGNTRDFIGHEMCSHTVIERSPASGSRDVTLISPRLVARRLVTAIPRLEVGLRGGSVDVAAARADGHIVSSRGASVEVAAAHGGHIVSSRGGSVEVAAAHGGHIFSSRGGSVEVAAAPSSGWLRSRGGSRSVEVPTSGVGGHILGTALTVSPTHASSASGGLRMFGGQLVTLGHPELRQFGSVQGSSTSGAGERAT